MVAAVSTSFNTRAAQTKATRPSSLPPEPESATATVVAHRRPKSRDVSSRYLSTSSTSSSCSSFSSFSSSASFRSWSSSTSSSSSGASAKRCPSPMVSRANQPTTPSAARRSLSAGRRQPATPRAGSLDPRGNGEIPTAQRMLMTPGRSLSVSFQGDSFSTKVNRSKVTPSPNIARREPPEKRKATTTATPGRGAGQRENSRPAEQWPRSTHPSSLSRSVDYTDERTKLSGSGNSVVRALQNSMIDNRLSSHGRVMRDSASADKEKANSSVVGSDSVVSDTESVSSGSNVSGSQEGNGRGQRLSARGIVVPARFLQETSNRLRRQAEPGSPVSRTNGLKTMASGRHIAVPRKSSMDSPVSSPKVAVNARGLVSPMTSLNRPASPSKFATPAASSLMRGMSPSRGTSPSRGMSPSRGISPSRVRSSLSNNFCNTPSILSFAADAKRGKIGENRVADAHLLRLFYNRLLQWRFANARANDVLSVQKIRAERSLYNAWISISTLYDSVRLKRIEVQLLKHNLKLISILKGQMTYLEEWIAIDREYTGSLMGAIEALRGSTLRLPVVCGAVANLQGVKDAICSAVDVMQAMASSICLLLSKVGKVSSLAAELANASLKEHNMLEECRDLLSATAALQVTECSLRTHTIQLQHPPPNCLTTQV